MNRSIPRRPVPIAALLFLVAALAGATEFYVSPAAGANGDGSFENPWTLATALAQPSALRPGDTIWVRGGTYLGPSGAAYAFSCSLKGSSGSPITVRQYPSERATIDGRGAVYAAVLVQYSSWTTFQGLEVTDSDTSRANATAGLWVRESNNVRFVNMIIHDAGGQGVGQWPENSDSELYGSLIYFNGSNRFHHGVYIQNLGPLPKRVEDNILFQNYGYGIHAYSSAGDSINHLEIEGNISFGNGQLTPVTADAGPNGGNLLVGGETVAASPRIVANYTYWPPLPSALEWKAEGSQQLGYHAGCTDAVVQDNYFYGGTTWERCTAGTVITGNAFYRGANQGIDVSAFPANLYASERPSGVRVFVRPNKYESGRANIAIYNWDHLPVVGVGVSGILTPGDEYEVRNAQDFFGPPVAQGTYSGELIAIPMTGLNVAAPVAVASPGTAGPEFGAFVLLSGSSARIPVTRRFVPRPGTTRTRL